MTANILTSARGANFERVIEDHFSASEPVSNHEMLRGTMSF